MDAERDVDMGIRGRIPGIPDYRSPQRTITVLVKGHKGHYGELTRRPAELRMLGKACKPVYGGR